MRSVTERKRTVLIVCMAFIILAAVFLLGGCGMSGDHYFLKGVEAYSDDDWSTAIENLKKAEELGVRDYEENEVYTYLGGSYLELDMYDNAIAYYQKVLDSGLAEVNDYVNIAVAYRQSGDTQMAIKYYMIALKIDPDYAELNSSLGSLYILEGRPEKAIPYFEKALSKNPSLAVTYGNAALAYAMIGDFEKADSYLEQAVIRGYDNADIIRERIDELRR